jgi:hypothetical protein
MQPAPQEPGLIGAVPGALAGHGRRARIAARRNFVEMKSSLLQITADLAGPDADSLRDKLRRADAAVELWLLRHQVFDALPARDRDTAALRGDLARRLEAVFADSAPGTTPAER